MSGDYSEEESELIACRKCGVWMAPRLVIGEKKTMEVGLLANPETGELVEVDGYGMEAGRVQEAFEQQSFDSDPVPTFEILGELRRHDPSKPVYFVHWADCPLSKAVTWRKANMPT